MLALSRKLSEKIIIEKDSTLMEIFVIEIRGDKVRLGFTAPKDWKIHREEVWTAIQAEKGITSAD